MEWAAQNGIVNGVGGGRFNPNQSVTREQMAVILYNYAKFTNCDLTTMGAVLDRFTDGHKTSRFAKYSMEWAVTHEIILGNEGKLTPQGTASRAQVAQIFYNSRELLDNPIGGDPQPPTPSPSPDGTPSPSPSPSPDPDAPKIEISDEVRDKLKPNQDPEKILDYVLNGKHDDPTFSYDGTTAKWDPTLFTYTDSSVGKMTDGSWLNIESDKRGSAAIANNFLKRILRTDSDRFYITAEDSIGSFCLYYRPIEKPDSDKMSSIKQTLNLPNYIQYDRSLCFEGAGWAGPMSWESYGGAKGIAESMEYVLTDMHQAVQYYITEPTPGI